jgi:hypothetical protein
VVRAVAVVRHQELVARQPLTKDLQVVLPQLDLSKQVVVAEQALLEQTEQVHLVAAQ